MDAQHRDSCRIRANATVGVRIRVTLGRARSWELGLLLVFGLRVGAEVGVGVGVEAGVRLGMVVRVEES